MGRRPDQEVDARSGLKNQLLGQLDRAFPGLTLALADVLGTKVGRLVATHFADPARLVALGGSGFIRFAATRGLQVRGRSRHDWSLPPATPCLPRGCRCRREVLAADLELLRVLEEQVAVAEEQLAALVPDSPYRTLPSVPGWGVVRAAAYGAAVGDPDRWPGPRQIYRASGLSPRQYESAGKRRDGAISREGSLPLRRALIDLGIGLWLNDPAAKTLRRGPAQARQQRRHHRLRPGPGPGPLRPRPLVQGGLTTPHPFPPTRDRVQAGR